MSKFQNGKSSMGTNNEVPALLAYPWCSSSEESGDAPDSKSFAAAQVIIGQERSCAFCHIPIKDSKMVKLCSKCNRRAYCGRDCQVKDWSVDVETSSPLSAKGQSHKNWCELGAGEEGLDWKIAHIIGKDLGIITLRPFCKFQRIIVDACQLRAEAHPMTKDLQPKGGTIESKFEQNCFGCDEQGDIPGDVLCLKIARVNHACQPNAGLVYLKKFNVKVLFALRAISPGEEICISYTRPLKQGFDQSINLLRNKWNNIQCLAECICRYKEYKTFVVGANDLQKKISMAKTSSMYCQKAEKAVKSLILNHEKWGSSIFEKKRALLSGFEVAVMMRRTLPEARDYLRQLIEMTAFFQQVLHPSETSEMKLYKTWEKDLSCNRNYLLFG